MMSPSMVAVTFISKASPYVQFDTAWTLETGPKQFVSLVSHFKAKEVLHRVKEKYASPLDTFCRLLQKRLSGIQEPLAGEVKEDGMVTVTATVQIVADPSAKKYTSPDVTNSAPETIAKAEAADTNHGFGIPPKGKEVKQGSYSTWASVPRDISSAPVSPHTRRSQVPDGECLLPLNKAVLVALTYNFIHKWLMLLLSM